MLERPLAAEQWRALLEQPHGAFLGVLRAHYGRDEHLQQERRSLFLSTLTAFIERFGNPPVRLFRCPGRINLRGMHVDTHGGYVNLMTHEREVVVVAAESKTTTTVFANVDPPFEEVEILQGPVASDAAFDGPWPDLIMQPGIRAAVEARRGHWGHYVRGCLLNVQHRFPGHLIRPLCAMVGSDLPRGASLSSSAALCVSTLQALLAWNGLALDPAGLIQAARDAEWYTGSRCGLSDQAAMVLGRRNRIVHAAFDPNRFDVSAAEYVRFPETLRVLVIQSHTERSLSGAALVDYTRNRFAYSLALEILRQEMRAENIPELVLAGMDRLANVCPERFENVGGRDFLLRLLSRIPEEISVTALKERYALPGLDEAYARYFGSAPESLRPQTIGLRGPLLYGIAESERARRFASDLAPEKYTLAGALMTIGHAGDRRVTDDGAPYVFDVSDTGLARWRDSSLPIDMLAGAYGASTPALDYLVDAALAGGALGACLTGAGLAGSVLALCIEKNVRDVAGFVRARMAHSEYAQRAGWDLPLTERQAHDAVRVNRAVAGAGELLPA